MRIGSKADIVAHRQYFENLARRVAEGIKAGRTLEQLQAARIMNEYRDWIEYDEDNDINIANAVQNAHRTLTVRRCDGAIVRARARLAEAAERRRVRRCEWRFRCERFGSDSMGS